MAEVKEKAVEVAVDAAEMTAEKAHVVAEHIPEVVQSLTRMKVGFAALGLAFGSITAAAIAYRVAEKRLREKYAAQAEEEIDSMRDHFRARLVVKDEKPDLTDLSKRAADLQYAKSPQEPMPAGGPGSPVLKAPVPMESRNVFETHPPIVPAWDYEVEKILREKLQPGVPYVIHEDERHDEDVVDYAETSLTWYAGDDILCDSDDRALPDVEMLVGLDNLTRFGDGTEDPDVMFVRNDRLEVIMEITRSPNSYAEEVHGISHSAEEGSVRRRRPRFPKWDD